MQPLVSVITPVYNAERFLARTVDSVLSQTYQNFELIMIDDCSKDKSLQIMREYAQKDDRIHIIEGKKNQGVARVRNLGIRAAKGEYIALLDSDDVWANTKLERQIGLMETHGAEIAYSSYDFIDENDNPVLHPFIVPEKTNYQQMLMCNVLGCSTVVVKAELLKKHPFKLQHYHEDYVLWMELMKDRAKAIGDTEILMHYRQVSGSRSNNKKNAAIQRWKIYREALGLGIIKSSIAFAGYMINGLIKYRV